MQEQAPRKRPPKFKKKGRNRNQNRQPLNGNNARNPMTTTGTPGVCVKCGHPAPDGKLCTFHRSLLNSIRNDFSKKTGRGPATPNWQARY